MPFEYRVSVNKVVDGDTVDIDIDLGFNVWIRGKRVRILGIDTPESRTSDKVEKIFGLAAKARLKELVEHDAVLRTIAVEGSVYDKYGRILGDFVVGEYTAGQILVAEGHAVAYEGENKDKVQPQHAINRERLIREGKVVLP